MNGLSEPMMDHPVNIVRSAPPPANEPSPSAYVAHSAYGFNGVVLVGDDDPQSRAVLERWIGMAGHRTQSFGDIASLVHALHSMQVDAVCLNLERTGMGGLDAIRAVRRSHIHVPIVFLTSNPAPEAQAAFSHEGAWECVTKPTEQSMLMKMVSHVVEKGRLMRHIGELENAQGRPPADWNGYLSEVLEEHPMKLDDLEQRAIIAAMKRTGGNVTQAMRELGIGRTTLYRKLKKYGMR